MIACIDLCIICSFDEFYLYAVSLSRYFPQLYQAVSAIIKILDVKQNLWNHPSFAIPQFIETRESVMSADDNSDVVIRIDKVIP